MHRLWKNTLINEIDPTKDMKLIDVAAGTGEILNGFWFILYLSKRLFEYRLIL
jgi:ubiquinone/menaquinone biosynthesis C-methylase UbiE